MPKKVPRLETEDIFEPSLSLIPPPPKKKYNEGAGGQWWRGKKKEKKWVTRTSHTPHNPQHQIPQTIQAQRKPHQIRTHHNQNIAHRPDPTNHPIRIPIIFPPLWREKPLGQNFRKHKKRNKPTPSQQAEIDIMPEGHKSEYGEDI